MSTRDRQSEAERQYQEGLRAAQDQQGERRKNLEHAIRSYNTALKYYTAAAFPARYRQIQQDLAAAYSEYEVRLEARLQPTGPESMPVRPPVSSISRRSRLLFGLLALLLILLIPTTVIAATYLNRNNPQCVPGTLNIDGSTVLQPFVQHVADEYHRLCPQSAVKVYGGASKTGLFDVEDGHSSSGIAKDNQGNSIDKVDIGIGNSDIFAPPAYRDLVDHQVAIGVFTMIVNAGVPEEIKNLATDQISKIYTGVYQTWTDICDKKSTCGKTLPIVPISRTLNSGTRFTFEKYILKGIATAPGIGLSRARSGDDAVQEVACTPYSIGYAPLYLVKQHQEVTCAGDVSKENIGMRAITIDGNDPNSTSLVQNNTYKFWNIEHMYTKEKAGPLVQAFIAYMYSDFASNALQNYALLKLDAVPQEIRDKHIQETA